MLRLRLLPAVTALGLAALLMTGFSGVARADTLLFANLFNSNENPPVNTAPRPASFGFATFVLNDAQTQLTYTATIFNIDVNGTQTPLDATDNLTNAHIHAADVVLPTQNAGVVWGFWGTPLHDIAPADTVMTPFATGVGGTFTGKWDLMEGVSVGGAPGLTSQLPRILSGNSYINFHTNQFGGGEIRGTITVPEPSSMLLLLAGTIGMGGLLRRRA